MSKLTELLQARIEPGTTANLANPANPHSAISNFSKGPSPDSAFTAELQRRIEAMAQRWAYKPEELHDALQRARANPIGWLHAVAYDEEREADFRSMGLLSSAGS